MTPKQKAHEIVEAFLNIMNGGEKFGWNVETARKQKEMALKSAVLAVTTLAEVFPAYIVASSFPEGNYLFWRHVLQELQRYEFE